MLKTSEPREYRAADSEELTERVLGFRLPIEGLAETVQGKPSPALERRGWKVEYQEYDAQRRPTRLRLTNAGAEVRLAIIAVELTLVSRRRGSSTSSSTSSAAAPTATTSCRPSSG